MRTWFEQSNCRGLLKNPHIPPATKFTKTTLLIYCLNQTFVVTVLTTIFVSDFPLLTKVLTNFVHPPPPQLFEIFSALIKVLLFPTSPSAPWQLLPKNTLAPRLPTSFLFFYLRPSGVATGFQGFSSPTPRFHI